MEDTLSIRDSAGWYYADLGDETFAWDACERIKDLFEPVYSAAGFPATMAVFLRRVTGDVHCHVHVYFSPHAADVALQSGARTIATPSPENLTLLCGAEAAWQALFNWRAP